jgi:hypothetical protein
MSEGTAKVSGKGDNKVVTVKKDDITAKYSKGDYCRFPGQAPDKYEIIKINKDSFIAGVARQGTTPSYTDSFPHTALYPMGALKHVPESEEKGTPKKQVKRKSTRKSRRSSSRRSSKSSSSRRRSSKGSSSKRKGKRK